MTRLAVSFALVALFGAAFGALEANGKGRQFIADDLAGQFELFVRQGSCPNRIAHKTFSRISSGAYSVPHKSIAQNGVACKGLGVMNVVTKDAIVNSGNEAVLASAPLKDVVENPREPGCHLPYWF